MKKITINMVMDTGPPQEVEAWAVGENLCVSRMPYNSKFWGITSTRYGFSVAVNPYTTKKAAVSAARAIANTVDWEDIPDIYSISQKDGQKLMDILSPDEKETFVPAKRPLDEDLLKTKFQIYFGTSHIFKSLPAPFPNKQYNFDIFEFDNFLHKDGYSEEVHGSMSDRIKDKYGKDARDFIQELIAY